MQKIIATVALLALLQTSAIRDTHAQGAAAKPPVLLQSAGRDTPFPDVPKDHWAYQAVEAVRKAGIIVGYPAAPPQTQTRRRPKAAGPRG